MPPKKKTRLPPRAISTPSGDSLKLVGERAQTPSVKNDVAKAGVLLDAWTDEQETSLFKGMIRWKPVGMHKHFRMIAISQNLRNHGYTSPRDDHTRIPYIWEKLVNLYNLEALDERENFTSELKTDEGNDRMREPFCQFLLPEDDYGDLMFAKRLAPEGSISPLSLPRQPSGDSEVGTHRQSSIDDTDDPRSSPASAVGQRSTRGTRRIRRSQLQEVSTPLAQGGESKASINNGVEEDQKLPKENEDDAGVIEFKGKSIAQNVPKAAGSKTRKRRSGRRR